MSIHHRIGGGGGDEEAEAAPIDNHTHPPTITGQAINHRIDSAGASDVGRWALPQHHGGIRGEEEVLRLKYSQNINSLLFKFKPSTYLRTMIPPTPLLPPPPSLQHGTRPPREPHLPPYPFGGVVEETQSKV